MFLTANPYSTQGQSHHEYYFNLYWVEEVDNPTVEKTYPERAIPDETQAITSLSYRKSTLPFSQDQDEDWYIVYPEHGIVVPILTPSTEDAKKINSWKSFNHYPYLEEGSLHYRWNSPKEGKGNMVIAAHSSFTKDEPWRYKTVFQALPISTAWDKIFIYLKNESDWFDLYTYEIFESFRTDIKNVKILSQRTTQEDHELTTYWCYAIWTNAERRVNKSKLIKTEKNIEDWTIWKSIPIVEEDQNLAPVITPVITEDQDVTYLLEEKSNTTTQITETLKGTEKQQLTNEWEAWNTTPKTWINSWIIKEKKLSYVHEVSPPTHRVETSRTTVIKQDSIKEHTDKEQKEDEYNKIIENVKKSITISPQDQLKESLRTYRRNTEYLTDDMIPLLNEIEKAILTKIKWSSSFTRDNILGRLLVKIDNKSKKDDKKSKVTSEIYKALYYRLLNTK